jgi:FixJ family two-component response regulator
LELQKRVAVELPYLPIIFLTGFGDIPMTVQAMKAGAVEFLTKPFSNESLVRAIKNAIERSRLKLDSEAQIQALRARYSALTIRERQVMALVVTGMLNKEVGDELGITEITVKFHRGNLMRKMKSDSFAELVNMAARLRIRGSPSPKAKAAQ